MRKSQLQVRFTVESLDVRITPTGSPFTDLTSQYVTSLPRGGDIGYDYQPTMLYDPTDTVDLNSNGVPDRLYKIWWLGRYMPPDVDQPPNTIIDGDRIYFRYSENGVNWSSPQVVLSGSGGMNYPIDGDDHLVGSPSVMKLGSTYYMFYEAMANWVTPLNHFYSAAKQDAWVTSTWVQYQQSNGYLNGPNANVLTADYDTSYVTRDGRKSDILGWAPQMPRAGTHPVYGMETTYYNPGGPKINRQLTLQPPTDWATPQNGEIRRSLNDQIINGQSVPQPLFWLYDAEAPGRVPVWQFWVPGSQDNVATNDPGAGDVPGAVAGAVLLGYAIADDQLAGPDGIGSSQNRVMMAKSTDGVNWTRYHGPARGGAVITPQYELSAWRGYDVAAVAAGQYPHNACLLDPNGPDVPTNWTVRRWNTNEWGYGAGHPVALERDGYLELYFKDTVESIPNVAPRRIRMPISQIENNASWLAARAPGTPSLNQFAGYSEDMKWSPTYRRYFIAQVNVSTLKPNIIYSAFDPEPNVPPTFMYPPPSAPLLVSGSGSLGDLPTGIARNADWGALLGDGLGHTVDTFPGGMTRLDFVYAAYTGVFSYETYFTMDLAISRQTIRHVLAAATGQVFNDLDNDGNRDAGEPPISGAIIYRDANNNGTADAGELATSSDNNGHYSLTGLPPAYSTLRVSPPPSFTVSTPARVVANTAGELFTGQNFALRPVVPPHVSQVVVNGGAEQRSRVTSLTVTFDMPVQLPVNPAAAFLLRRNSDQAVVALAGTAGSNSVTLTFTGGSVDSGSLADGRYSLTVFANQVVANGYALDGDNNGTPGGDYLLIGNPTSAPKLYRLFGDVDGDGDVDSTDFGAFRGVFGGASDVFDFDDNGDVDTSDFGAFRTRFGTSL